MNEAVALRSDWHSLRRLWSLSGPSRPMMLAGIGLRFLQSLALGAGFAVTVAVLGGLASGRQMSADWAMGITLALVASLAGQVGFGYLSMRLAWLSSFRATQALRLTLLGHLGRLPMGFHLSRHDGDSTAALTSDMQMIESFMSDALPQIAQSLGLPLAMLVFLAMQDWVLALAAAATVLMALPLFVISSQRLARLGLIRQDRQAQASADMIEYVQGLAVIRAFNRSAEAESRFHAALKAFRDISITLTVQLVRPMVLVGVVLMLGVPLVIALAGLRLGAGATDPVALIAVLVLILSIYAPLMAMLSVMELARLAEAALIRVDRILDAEPLPEPEEPRAPTGFALEFENVSFGYAPGMPILRDVSFSVPERATIALVGPSGAGKSTVLNLIARFWEVGQGRILLGGVDLRDLGSDRLADLVTVVFQDAWLCSGTIRDNIALGLVDATDEQIIAAAREAQAHDFIAALPLGYDTPVAEGGTTLSGGERQRISIARAFLKNAPIVLLDEATSAIDPQTDRALRRALVRLARGRTLIIVAHKLSSVRAADEILMLNDGRITARGTHEALIGTDATYRRWWQMQQAVDEGKL